MPFRYRLQKALDFRIRKKDQQLQVVILAQQEVYKIEGMIELNNREIDSTRINMKKADFYMLDAYDKFLKSLYEKAEQLEEEKKKAEEVVAEEKRKLVEANLRFVVKIAHRYKSFMDLEDLIIEGTMGLMHEDEKIDPANNTKVITYAANWITAYIQKAIRE